MHIKEFYSCPSCGRTICGEKERYFTCPVCGRAICKEKDLSKLNDKYCGNCGSRITSAKEEAMALAKKEI